MFESIAVVGLGVIGSVVASQLTMAGRKVTAVSLFRLENAKALRTEGLTIVINDVKHHLVLNARHISELDETQDKFDLVLVTGKCNDTAVSIRSMMPFMKEDTVISTFQNGVIEDYILPEFSSKNIIPVVCYTGGQMPLPRYVVTHDGIFAIGELTGEVTDRLMELKSVLQDVKDVIISDNIMLERWKKLSSCGITVPTATVSGYSLFGCAELRPVYTVYARLACEIYNVAKACGYVLPDIEGLPYEDWYKIATGRDEGSVAKFLNRSVRPPEKENTEQPMQEDNGLQLSLVDAYTQDILRGVPLELIYTNGFVIKKSQEVAVPAYTHERIVNMIYEIQAGKRERSPDNLDIILEATNKYYM